MSPQAERFDRWLRCRSPHTTTPVDYLYNLKHFFAWAGNPPTAITLHDVNTYIDHGRRLGNTIATANRLDYFYEDGVQTDLTRDANPL
jgi:hypothetical protein